MTESTWEPVESLPITLVEEYEAGIRQDVQKDALTAGGQTVFTVLARSRQGDTECLPKRLKLDLTDSASNSTGYVPTYVDATGLLIFFYTFIIITQLFRIARRRGQCDKVQHTKGFPWPTQPQNSRYIYIHPHKCIKHTPYTEL